MRKQIVLAVSFGRMQLRKQFYVSLAYPRFHATKAHNNHSREVRAIKAVIPPKSNRKIKRDCDFALYAERNLVERFFNAIKQLHQPAWQRP